MRKTFIVEQNKLRLDRFLAEQVTQTSRSKIQKDIEAGAVLVNSQKILEGKFVVRKGDQVEYEQVEPEEIQAQELEMNIVFENDDLLIIDKLAGLVVHPAPGYKGPTLAQGLMYKYAGIKIVGEDTARPGIVHRLDKDTSGVMLVAKTQSMFEHLKDAFAARKIKKEYITLLAGHLPNKHGFIHDPIGRHPTDFRKMATVRATEAKEAITEYSILEYLDAPQKSPLQPVDEYTLVRVKLHTGRTHQIRVHFSSLGLPVAGDTLYGSRNQAAKQKNLGINRQFLHAQKIEVQMPDGSWIEAHAELPSDLKEILKLLNSKVSI